MTETEPAASRRLYPPAECHYSPSKGANMADDILPERKESKLINVCGLWKHTSMAGNPYLRGRMGNAVVLIMPNRFKTQDNQPDLIMYFAPPVSKDREDRSNDSASSGGAQVERTAPDLASIIDDDLPF